MPGTYSVPTRASGSILTATIYNSDHGLHVTYNTPGGCDDASATVSAMQATADPGEVGTESLATDLLGELQRIRKLIVEITGKTYWYETPDTALSSIFLKGANIALASTLVPVGEFEYADVTGSGINVLAIQSEPAGKRRKLRFQNAVNLIHDGTALILPFGKIYRTMPNEFITFESLGSGNWIMSDYSGPHEPPGLGHDFLGASAPAGYVLQAAQSLNCTDYEGLFTELVANLDQEGYDTPVGTVTADNSNETFTLNTHGLEDGDVVHFANSGGALPSGLSAKTLYYVRDSTTNTFTVTATRGGSAVDLADNGTGTTSIYNTFLAPDARGRVDLGKDDLGGTPANRITSASTNGANSTTLRGVGGAQTHTLSASEVAQHQHIEQAATGASPNQTIVPLKQQTAGGTGGNNMNTLVTDVATDSVTGSQTDLKTALNDDGGSAHSNTQPWRAVTKIVRT